MNGVGHRGKRVSEREARESEHDQRATKTLRKGDAERTRKPSYQRPYPLEASHSTARLHSGTSQGCSPLTSAAKLFSNTNGLPTISEFAPTSHYQTMEINVSTRRLRHHEHSPTLRFESPARDPCCRHVDTWDIQPNDIFLDTNASSCQLHNPQNSTH